MFFCSYIPLLKQSVMLICFVRDIVLLLAMVVIASAVDFSGLGRWPSAWTAAATRTNTTYDVVNPPKQMAVSLSGQGRQLLQSSTTPVTTPAQLQTAIASGAPRIVVQQHMDLSILPTSEQVTVLQVAVLGVVLSTTRSISGACATAPGLALSPSTGAALRPLLPGQCLLLTDTTVLTVTNSSLWMDNLYLRLLRSARTAPQMSLVTTGTQLLTPGLLTGAESPALYLSGITLQGDGLFEPLGFAGHQSCNGLLSDFPIYMQGARVPVSYL
eukprot:jgi/Ulvmu1/8594/UM045_0037.1